MDRRDVEIPKGCFAVFPIRRDSVEVSWALKVETKDSVQISSINSKNFIDSNEFSSQTFDSDNFKSLRNNLLNAVAEVNKWKSVIISRHDAEKQAELEYINKPECEI